MRRPAYLVERINRTRRRQGSRGCELKVGCRVDTERRRRTAVPQEKNTGWQGSVAYQKAAAMKYGYASVSTEDHNPALQLTALKKACCKTVFTDELSGATTKCPALLRSLNALEPGDTLTVWKLDRLGRSLRDLIAILDDLKQRGVKFRSLTEAIDTDTPTGRAMWQMLGVLAELERLLIIERPAPASRRRSGAVRTLGRIRSLPRRQLSTRAS